MKNFGERKIYSRILVEILVAMNLFDFFVRKERDFNLDVIVQLLV